ncbi:NACHT domain-containing protein, partial [Plectosphaerella plurivora]
MGRFTQSLARRFKGSSRPESPVQAASPAPPPPTATLKPSAESPAETSSPKSSAPEISAPNLQGRLWNQAYDGVKADEPKIVEAYERLLSELQNDADSALASDKHAERERQMEQLVEIGLQRTEKAAALAEKVGDGLQTVMTVKGLVSSAVQVAPAAAVAWVGVCFALEVLSNSFTEASTNRTGLAYVVSRMDWYWNLVDLLLDSGAKTELAGLRGRLEVHIIKLYQELLLYQMKSVCLFHQNQGVLLLKNSIKLDDWKGQLDEIKVAEAALLEDSKQYNSQRVHKHLQDLAHIAEGQRDKLELMTSAIQDQTSRQEQMYQDEKDSQCLHALCETDPRLDKARIQDNKGGLLRDSYTWVLDNPDFKEWRTNPDHGLLWIRGDPGKGKTMLLCGILDELEKDSTSRQAYFFCQETNRNLNNATAVLRGLIFSLVCQQPKLISYVRKEYDPVGQKLFEGSNVWEAMSKILTAILSDTSLGSTVLIVDALDECSEGRAKLLKLITAQSVSARIKWVVSSRNWVDIQEQLNIAGQKVTLHLELNAKSISAAVKAYIRDKVGELARLKEYDEETRATVEQTFVDKADNTFLWVALAFQELAAPDVQSWEASDILQTLPLGLQPLYQRMMEHIEQSRHKKLCRDILAAVSVVYRPISLLELISVVESLARFTNNLLALEKLISCCGSFLTLQGNVIAFVHQSAKDFLLSEGTIDQILPCGIQHQHRTIFSTAVKALSETLRRDLYQLKNPGASIDASLPSPDPLTPLWYACAYWVDHLQDADITADLTQQHLHDDSTVHDFLRSKYLYWLEAACFSRDISGAILALQKVETVLTQITSSPQLSALVRDALRFVHWCRRGIESTPLQLYASALLFCPRRSV